MKFDTPELDRNSKLLIVKNKSKITEFVLIP